LIITRAAVFSMPFMSGLIGGLLAITQVGRPDWRSFCLAVLGLVLAHAANNMTNDYFRFRGRCGRR
jgi:1,4-dihydroxy-2-naphthoate octaprenyltransferase